LPTGFVRSELRLVDFMLALCFQVRFLRLELEDLISCINETLLGICQFLTASGSRMRRTLTSFSC